ncbi:MAG TPA: sigma-70 family RNA polymerase sigma factor [Planctomycetaceae bacterium]|nr:sigma-70 family RNA polymerase sigma factor [Planctomycetaceae bacterium]
MGNPTPSRRRLSLTACTMIAAASAVSTAPAAPAIPDAAARTGSSAAAPHTEAVQRIGRYCDASWRNARISRDDWDDCTQEVYLRLLERCSLDGLTSAIDDPGSAERRELNRSIWATAQRWRRAARPLPLNEAGVPDHRERGLSPRSDLEVLLEADCLSDRQRQILSMAADGYAVAEIAESLGLSPARVSDEKYKAVAKLGRHCVATGARLAS